MRYFNKRWHYLLNIRGVAEVVGKIVAVVSKGDVQERSAMFGAPPFFSSLSCSCFDSATAIFS